MKASRPLLSAMTLSMLAALAAVTLADLSLLGRVKADHLLAGLLVSALVVSPIMFLANRLVGRRVSEDMAVLTRQLGRHALEVADLYQNAPCGYHSLDRDGVFRRINDTELGWLGYTRNEIVDKLKIMDLVSQASLATCQATFSSFLETGVARDVALELVRKDGTTLPVLISATAIRDADGRFLMSRSTVYDMSEQKRIERERAAYAQRLAEMSRRLIDAQEDARRRLSRELHDRIAPSLAAIDISLGMIASALPELNGPEVAARLADTRALIADTTIGIDEISADLRPPVLDHAGLVPALESYADQFARRTGIEVRLDCADSADGLPRELETLLFRIAQEALCNCAKHACASSVAVTLRPGARHALLTIEDDGAGFGPSATGHPVAGMRDMAEFAGGSFSIESLPGAGTRIRVEV